MTTELIAQLEEYAERKLSEAWSCMDGGADLCIGAALAADAADALSELQAENQRLREALRACGEALDLHGKMYPHMVKGYTLDALNGARAALRSTREGG